LILDPKVRPKLIKDPILYLLLDLLAYPIVNLIPDVRVDLSDNMIVKPPIWLRPDVCNNMLWSHCDCSLIV